jgi:hypothetical protein
VKFGRTFDVSGEVICITTGYGDKGVVVRDGYGDFLGVCHDVFRGSLWCGRAVLGSCTYVKALRGLKTCDEHSR